MSNPSLVPRWEQYSREGEGEREKGRKGVREKGR
jgi:hypothetical protein